jgi:hypothetical protein
MTRKEAEVKDLVKKAVQVKQAHPTLGIPAVTPVTKFTSEEAEARTLQQPHPSYVLPTHQPNKHDKTN